MYTLSAKLTFNISYAVSLKDKRQVSRSIIAKVRQKFNVSIAEVDTQNAHRTLTLGIAIVSCEMSHAQNSLDEVIRFMEDNIDAELTAIERE